MFTVIYETDLSNNKYRVGTALFLVKILNKYHVLRLKNDVSYFDAKEVVTVETDGIEDFDVAKKLYVMMGGNID